MLETKKNTETLLVKKDSKLVEFIKTLGPGVVTVLTWLGAGDIINSAVSGANYGYALMWVLLLANLVRFAIVNVMARFELCNNEDISIIEYFGRIGKFFPILLFIAPILMGHLTVGYQLKGAGEALYYLTSLGSPFFWSLGAVVAAVLIMGRSVYGKLENIMKILLAVLTLVFVGLAIYATPDVFAIISGTFLFEMPQNTGTYGVMLVIMGLVGAVAGSLGNFLYGINIREKGWHGPEQKKKQGKELLFSVIMGAVLVMCVWIVGAEILLPNGLQVETIQDIGVALEMYLGKFGSSLFYLGVAGALFSSMIGHSTGFPKISVANLNVLKPERKEKYPTYDTDPLYRFLMLFTFISPLIWSIPGMPNFVFLTLFVNALNVVLVPAIAIGLLITSNRKSIMGKYTNNILENVILVLTTILALYSTYGLVISYL